ncbi:hypothetical protein D6825_02775 [Candidatus Woesearchaeota archaeon]|nr:MAG: hypothetical protein D6825_02775 [Candidatus Woesearchaeota archaeon]
MKAKAIIAFVLFLAVIASASAAQIPLVLEEVEFDDTTLSPYGDNRLSVERGEEYDVRVQITPTADISDAQMRITIDGYEFSDVEDIQARTQPEDYSANVTYVEKLKLKIPSELDRDNYKLRLTIADKYNNALVQEYNLKIDAARHALRIDDVVFSPNSAVRAGSALLTTVRVENKGEQRERDVRVTVSVPELGIAATDYIEEIDDGDEEEETEEIFLRIPRCSKPGVYDVLVEAEYQRRHKKVSERKSITVLEDETCAEDAAPKTTVSISNQAQSVTAGESAVYPITVTNAGRVSRTFTVQTQSAEWADVSITPTSTLVVPAGATQTVFVNVAAHEDAPAGAHSLVATIASGEFSQQVMLTTNVSEKTSSAVGVLTVVLIVLIVLLVIVGLVLLISLLNREEGRTETYY